VARVIILLINLFFLTSILCEYQVWVEKIFLHMIGLVGVVFLLVCAQNELHVLAATTLSTPLLCAIFDTSNTPAFGSITSLSHPDGLNLIATSASSSLAPLWTANFVFENDSPVTVDSTSTCSGHVAVQASTREVSLIWEGEQHKIDSWGCMPMEEEGGGDRKRRWTNEVNSFLGTTLKHSLIFLSRSTFRFCYNFFFIYIRFLNSVCHLPK
jgi:hypothetical protein